MNCPACGKQIPDVVYFCIYCGNNVCASTPQKVVSVVPNPALPIVQDVGSCSYRITQVLSYVPGLALHRFYSGRIGSAIAQILLWTVFVGAIWQFVDVILILTNSYTDNKGKKLSDYNLGFGIVSLLVSVFAFFFVIVQSSPSDNSTAQPEKVENTQSQTTGTAVNNFSLQAEATSQISEEKKLDKSSTTEAVAIPAQEQQSDNSVEESALKTSLEKLAIGRKETPEPRRAPIADGAVYKYPETAQELRKSGYPKMLKKFGVKKIKEINKLLPLAAEKAAMNPSMDEIVHVDVSNNRSTKNKLVFYVDAKNHNRIYLTEEEIKSDKKVLSNQEKLKSLLQQHVDMCEQIIKNQLAHPSTYKKSFFDSASETQDYTNVIRIAFSAKNSFNLEIKYVAIFRVNEQSEIVYQDIQEKR
ncbi:MAG: TM2 domain-containing protein [Akkermansia sp.]|nr:TM2 domain-containing protein [Akkermansia sp.]